MNARVEEEEEMTQQAGSPIRYLPIEKDYRQVEKRTSTGHIERPLLVNSATSTGRITPHTRVTLLPVAYDTLPTGHQRGNSAFSLTLPATVQKEKSRIQ